MIKPVIALVSIALLSLGSPLLAAPHGGGGRYAGPPGGVAGPNHGAGRPGWGGGYGGARHVHGGYRGYGGWYGGYWGPRVGFHYGGPGYWGGWPAAWGASYAYASPYGYPYAYPYGYGYSAAPVVGYETAQAQSFIQQEPVAVAAPQASSPFSYWFYCTQPAGYFPYVKECSQPWLTVVPQAPGQQSTAPRVAP